MKSAGSDPTKKFFFFLDLETRKNLIIYFDPVAQSKSNRALPSKLGGLVLYEEGCVMNNTFTGHNTFIFLFPTRPRAFFFALICSGCHGLGWADPRVYQEHLFFLAFPAPLRSARDMAHDTG